MHDRADELAELGEAARARRRALGLRQRDVADLAGCSERFVHVLEHGKPTLQIAKMLDVLEALGLGLTVRPGHGEIDTATNGAARP